MSYTSEEYKYLLMKRLQRHFSAATPQKRAYYFTFFGKLFDQSVTVTEESYNSFVSLMDDEIDYCAKNGKHNLGDFESSEGQEHLPLLQQSFAAIGVTLEYSDESGYYQLIFTKPNGEVLVFEVNQYDTNDYFRINAVADSEYRYAKLSAPWYEMREMAVMGLDEVNVKNAGPGCYWSYSAGSAVMTITGDGAYAGAAEEEQLGSGAYTTLLLGADVSRLLKSSIDKDDITVVLLRAADAPLALDDNFYGDPKDTRVWTVYTDNLALRNYGFPSSMDITWHTLDEWEG